MQDDLRTCDDIWDALSAYADGEAAPSDAAAVERHIRACGSCAEALSFMRESAGLLRNAPLLEPPPGLRERILAVTINAPARRRPNLTDLARAWLTPARGAALAAACTVAFALAAYRSVPSYRPLMSLSHHAPAVLRSVRPIAAAAARAPVIGAPVEGLVASARRIRRAAEAAAEQPRSPEPERVAVRAQPFRAPAAMASAVVHPAPLRVASRSADRLAPVLHPERSDPPATDATPASPAPQPTPDPTTAVASANPDTSHPASAAHPDESTSRSSHVALVSAGPSSDAPVTTIAELRRTLRRAAREPEIAMAALTEHHELTVNLVQSRF